MPALLLLALLWFPGALLRRALGLAPGPWGTGRLAVEACLSLALLSAALLPVYLASAPLVLAPLSLAAALGLVVVFALARGRGTAGNEAAALADGADATEIACFVAALALLLPVTLVHSGANVDDWWDLSFVSGWIADGHYSFAQMALTADPATRDSAVHPRFLWSVWLLLQSVVAWASGTSAWKVQAGALAALSMVLVVSAQAALARALGRLSPSSPRLVTVTLAVTVAWIWGSEALPLFARVYQDKLFAGFVLAPVFLALVLDALGDNADRRRAAAAVAAAAIATVSVHSLVFTMALFTAGLAVAAVQGRATLRWLRSRPGVVLALALPALYPLGQALALMATFGEQGVSLATPDNPVVRAHLALNRIVGVSSSAWVVHPGAVFGSIAVGLLVALPMAWRRRREAASRVLLAITIVPSMLLFVPGLAAAAGRLWVPWMLYRLGWMVPVAALLAQALAEMGDGDGPGKRKRIAAGVLAVLLAAAASTTAVDRLRRGMGEHPGQPSGEPVAAAAVVFDFLASREGREAVLAPPNFSELVPALTGKPVVAFPERGSLVFSADEAGAYARMRDRARFFSADATAAERDAIAAGYGVRWAVLPRTLVASGSEAWWIWRFGAEAFLAAESADRAGAAASAEAMGGGWWSASRAGVVARLLPSWRVVLETRDYFVVERDGGGAQAAAKEAVPAVTAQGRPRWLSAFSPLDPVSSRPGGDVLATVAGAPGARVSFSMPPRYMAPLVQPIWSEGPAAWEDAPAEVTIALDWGVACPVSAVEVLPHLPREKRDVFEVVVDGQRRRAVARHRVSIAVAVETAEPRSQVTVSVRSLLGNPLSIDDVRVLGDSRGCRGPWPAIRKPLSPELAAGTRDLLSLARRFPTSGRPLVGLARKAGKDRGRAAVLALLEEATRREPSLVEGWIELGFAQQAEAASKSGEEAETAGGRAELAFASAVLADSRSAWAWGCRAWEARGSGHPLAAIRDTLTAAQLDPAYGDAWTILAYALGDLHGWSLAERALRSAEEVDPERNWPALARADLARARGDHEAAAAALRAWLYVHPFDEMVAGKLSEIEGVPDATPGGKARP